MWNSLVHLYLDVHLRRSDPPLMVRKMSKYNFQLLEWWNTIKKNTLDTQESPLTQSAFSIDLKSLEGIPDNTKGEGHHITP